MNRLLLSLTLGWMFVAIGGLARAQSPASAPTPEQAIIETIRTYVDAYNRRDAVAVADHWAENAMMLAVDTQEKVVGRDAIREDLARQFEADPKSQLEVNVTSIRLVTDTVAVEDGIATVLRDGSAYQSTYSVVHVKQKDGWKIDSVRETDVPDKSGPQLSQLSWLVGSWADSDEDATVESQVKWARNEKFLTMSFRVDVPDASPLEGTQIIGVDPATGKIRSWLFDSDGGIGQGSWSSHDGKWIVELNMTLPSGESASAVYVYTPVDASRYTWHSRSRIVAGQFLPDMDEVLVNRVAEQPEKAEEKSEDAPQPK
ncbi:YybH family protein [Planctomycetaceae bacterium SH139]